MSAALGHVSTWQFGVKTAQPGPGFESAWALVPGGLILDSGRQLRVLQGADHPPAWLKWSMLQ